VKELISVHQDREAMVLMAEIKIQKGKLDKAYFYLDHCLKFEYRNSQIWSLLGNLYSLKATHGQPEEIEFNLEKATFCHSKAAKYEGLLTQDSQRLLSLIPKYIN
jgi:hypothetical protein